jgi:putative membrane protein
MNHSEHLHNTAPGFFELWSPWIFLLTLGIGIVYLYLTGAGGSRFKGYERVSGRQKVYFILGVLLFWGAEGTPIHYYGHADLFSSHMLAQSMLYLCMPPLLYLGLPAWLIRPVLTSRSVRWIRFVLTQPLLAILGFNLIFSIYHIPMVFNYVYGIPALHTGYHVLILAAAFHMWFPVFCPLPEWNRLTDLQRMAYTFANGVLLTPACALIIFAKSLVYDPYLDAPILIQWLHGLDDQQMGGVVMKIIQEIVYGSVLAYSFMKWYRRERREEDYPGDPDAPSSIAAAAAVNVNGGLNRA